VLVVDDKPPVTADDGVDVLALVVVVGVGLGAHPGWKLNLVDLERRHPEVLADALVERARGRCGPLPAVMVLGSTMENDINAGYG